MAASDRQFQIDLLRRLGVEGMDRVRPRIPSSTLRRALNLFVLDETHARIQIPHYWALYVHDGRGPFGPKRSTFLVWFRDPKDDPRLRAGVTPVRARQLRRLTRDQFRFWLRRNREAIRQGREPPMIVTRRVRKGQPPSNFFLNEAGGGMAGFVHDANTVGTRMFRNHVVNHRLSDVMSVKDTATAVIG